MPAKMKKRGVKKQKTNQLTLPFYTTSGLPARREVLAYHATGLLAEPVAAAGTVYAYRLNSIYDPDYTGVGGSACGYSAKALLYGRYKVMRARVCVRMMGSSGGNCVVGTLVGGNTTISSSPVLWAVEPNSRSKLMQGNTGTPHSYAEFNFTVDIPKVQGITRKQFEIDLDYQSVFGASPAQVCFLHIWLYGQSGAAQSVFYDVRIAYDTEFSQPLQSVTA